MCGRFDRHSSLADFAHAIDGLHVAASEALPPSYNVAPSQRALVVRDPKIKKDWQPDDSNRTTNINLGVRRKSKW